MTATIQINICSDSDDPRAAARDVKKLLSELLLTTDPERVTSAAVNEATSAVSLDVEVEQPKAKPKPRAKAKPKAKAEDKPEHDSSADTPEKAADKSVEDLPADEARKKGTEILHKVYHADASTLEVIVAIQGKYGVTKFADVSDDNAHSFLADAVLAENGNFAVPV